MRYSNSKIKFFIGQVWQGKTIYRLLFNWKVLTWSRSLSGEVLDLAGGARPEYEGLLPKAVHLIRTDLIASNSVQGVDLNKPLPFSDESFQTVFFFNAIYILEDRVKTLSEIRRILKPGGKCFIASPFIANEMPEPHDYCRLTKEGLERELLLAGFSDYSVQRLGERFTSAAYLLSPAFRGWLLRFVFYGLALIGDRLVPRRVRIMHPAPLGYFITVRNHAQKD